MEKYLEFAKGLALESGDIMLKYFKKGMEQSFKEDLSIVTNADKEINRLVIEWISEMYPTHSILGEEESDEKKSDLVWLCDPIDGTHVYAKGIPVSVFSLALVKKGVPIVGVVYDPFSKSLFSAVKGGGAYKNKEKISVSKLGLTSETTINIDWRPEAEYDVDTAIHKLSVDTKAYVLHLGSVIYASCLVANGKYEATVFPGTKGKGVDIAAVKVIVEEAGGKVTDLFDNEQIYAKDIKGAIVSNGVVHEGIVEYTKELE